MIIQNMVDLFIQKKLILNYVLAIILVSMFFVLSVYAGGLPAKKNRLVFNRSTIFKFLRFMKGGKN